MDHILLQGAGTDRNLFYMNQTTQFCLAKDHENPSYVPGNIPGKCFEAELVQDDPPRVIARVTLNAKVISASPFAGVTGAGVQPNPGNHTYQKEKQARFSCISFFFRENGLYCLNTRQFKVHPCHNPKRRRFSPGNV